MAKEKTSLSYKNAKGNNPKHPGQYTYRPQPKLAKTASLDTALAYAKEMGFVHERENVAKSCFEGVLKAVLALAAQGRPVKIDGFGTLKLAMGGTVDGYGGQITSANTIRIAFRADKALKLSLDDYSFTNEDAGKAARITAVQTAAGSYPKGVIAAGDIDILGSNLAFAAGDKIEFWAVNDAGVRTSSSAKWTITAANQVKTNTDKLLEVTLNNELDPSGKYEVVVTHVKTVDGKTIETSSNAFKVAVDAGQGGA